MCVCGGGKIWGQRTGDGRAWNGRDRTREEEVEMVRPRKRNGKEQEIEKIPEECWVYGILRRGLVSGPLHMEVQSKGLWGRGGKRGLDWVGFRWLGVNDMIWGEWCELWRVDLLIMSLLLSHMWDLPPFPPPLPTSPHLSPDPLTSPFILNSYPVSKLPNHLISLSSLLHPYLFLLFPLPLPKPQPIEPFSYAYETPYYDEMTTGTTPDYQVNLRDPFISPLPPTTQTSPVTPSSPLNMWGEMIYI